MSFLITSLLFITFYSIGYISEKYIHEKSNPEITVGEQFVYAIIAYSFVYFLYLFSVIGAVSFMLYITFKIGALSRINERITIIKKELE